MSAKPLPEGSNAPGMIRRLRAIDAEIYGTLYAKAGTLGDLTVEGILTMAEGGLLRTALSGLRLEIEQAKNRVSWYSGDGDEEEEMYLEYEPGTFSSYWQGGYTTVYGLSTPPSINMNGQNGYISLYGRSIQLGVEAGSNVFINKSGTAGAPVLAINDYDTGLYLASPGQLGIAANGDDAAYFSDSALYVQSVYDATTGDSSNVVVEANGRIIRSTSTEANKQAIKPWASDGSILDVRPVTFYPMIGNERKGEKMKRVKGPKRLGLTFENVLKHFPKGARKNDKGLDWNAITTALLSEVQQLKARIEVLESA